MDRELFEWIYKHKKQFTNFALIQSDMAEKKNIKRIFTNIYYPVVAAQAHYYMDWGGRLALPRLY